MGHIPYSLGNLTRLVNLELSENRLIDTIRPLKNLTLLTDVDLTGNSLKGTIPSSFGNMLKLEYLSLFDNQFGGEIPSSFGRLSHLKFLLLISNSLTELGMNMLIGRIPSSLGNLVQLTRLDLSCNQLVGEIPLSFKDLLELNVLALDSNQLSGEIPSSLGRLTQLECIYLSSNQFHGEIPSKIFQLQDLSYLQLNSSNLSSCNLNSFSEFLQDQDNLRELDLSYSNIYGQVPEWFLNVTTKKLNYLNLFGNFLTSFALNPIIFKWKILVAANLTFNKLQGSHYFISNNRLSRGISPLICNLSSIQMIDLSDKNLTRFIPQCLSNLSGTLEVMSLHRPLPRSLHNCNNLEFLNLRNNHITDVFTSWLGSLLSLKVLILQYNGFHGLIEEQAYRIEFPMLQIVDLSQNILSGSLRSGYFKHWIAMKVSETNPLSYIRDAIAQWQFYPSATFDYSMSVIAKGIEMNYSKIQEYLTLIDLSSNNFSGVIPESIRNLKQLELLNLSNNMLSGPLPPFLANLTNLEQLDLSQNQLSREIPLELTQLTSLAVFNVSYNHLTGPIPQLRQFATFENNSYKGNSWLCGNPLSRKCEDLKASPLLSPTSEEDQDSGSAMELDWKIVCMGYVSDLVIGVVLENTLITRRRAQSLVKNFGRTKQRRKRWKRLCETKEYSYRNLSSSVFEYL
ncbi:hypothetical protein ACJRO7_001582 [Eucalyptus globulus]|uniref:Disease resistance R13L4/SHOC-2-like LRR domain-containing protein n=1 Tax=Eucalyptus globulus TaxID=34317 RepID=A0ABD3LX44_EUCGL